MNIWLDDERTPPEEWTWARTPEEVISALSNGDVESISLDHDLGEDETGQVQDSGYDVVEWLENMYQDGYDFWPNQIIVHSQNPVGADNIIDVIHNSRLYEKAQSIFITTPDKKLNAYLFNKKQNQMNIESHFLYNDMDRYEVYIHNQSVLAASSLSVALQEYRKALRQLSRYSSVVRIYDNHTKKWIR